jgi:hypothetical protein
MTNINELHLQNDSSQRVLRGIAQKHEEVLVTENFVRLDVKRLQDLLYVRADEVYGLENRKIQLKLSMEERKHEILVHKDVLKVHLRTAEEERHQRAKELAQRLTKVLLKSLYSEFVQIEKLKRKYQSIMLQLSAGEDSQEEEKSQTYYIIKAAQEKEELRKQSEVLMLEIDKTSRDIQGLENSLTAFNALNQKYAK